MGAENLELNLKVYYKVECGVEMREKSVEFFLPKTRQLFTMVEHNPKRDQQNALNMIVFPSLLEANQVTDLEIFKLLARGGIA